MIPEYSIANNCDIYNLVGKTLDLAYMGSPWHGTMKHEFVNLVEKIRYNTTFKNTECTENSNIEKFWRKNSVIWNHTDYILNLNKKYSISIHVDPNHTDSN